MRLTLSGDELKAFVESVKHAHGVLDKDGSLVFTFDQDALRISGKTTCAVWIVIKKEAFDEYEVDEGDEFALRFIDEFVRMIQCVGDSITIEEAGVKYKVSGSTGRYIFIPADISLITKPPARDRISDEAIKWWARGTLTSGFVGNLHKALKSMNEDYLKFSENDGSVVITITSKTQGVGNAEFVMNTQLEAETPGNCIFNKVYLQSAIMKTDVAVEIGEGGVLLSYVSGDSISVEALIPSEFED